MAKLSYANARSLSGLVQKGIVNAPTRIPNPNGRGQVSVYSPESVEQAILADQLRQEGYSYDDILTIIRLREFPLSESPEPVYGSRPSIQRMRIPELVDANGGFLSPSEAGLRMVLQEQKRELSAEEFTRFSKAVEAEHIEAAGSLLRDGFNPMLVFKDGGCSTITSFELLIMLDDTPHQPSGILVVPMVRILDRVFGKCLDHIPEPKFKYAPYLVEHVEIHQTEDRENTARQLGGKQIERLRPVTIRHQTARIADLPKEVEI
tara:strand:+ start:359 stop:1147 length:789 start_codon:yes stop_codon:yes gene_type:complete